MKGVSRELTVLIAASGSGGHLLPAVFIAEAILQRNPDAKIVFVGSGRPLEEKIIGARGFPLRVIRTFGVKHLGIRGIARFAGAFPGALSETRKMFREVQPDVVVGVGGYVSVLPVLWGWFMGIPSVIHEAELSPGLANRVLAFFASRMTVAFEEAITPYPKKTIVTGHPVRPGLEVVRSFDPLSLPPARLLVLGGSQGSSALDETLPMLGDFFGTRNIEVYHQCRKGSEEVIRTRYGERGVSARVSPFIDDMADAYRWAHVVVSRSGAGSVMEIGVVNLPTVFVPYPFAQGNHQLANAKTLERAGKALIVEEGPQFSERLRQALEILFELREYNKMKMKDAGSRSIDAAHRISSEILLLASKTPAVSS